MKKYNTQAIVLKSINYKDADRLYTLLTKDYGKITAIARGVRKISSRRSGNLDSLNFITVKITESSKGFKSIDEVQTHSSYKELKSKYPNVIKAYYLAELVHRSLEEDATTQNIFELLKSALDDLSSDEFPFEKVVPWFEVSFLKFLGYEISGTVGAISTDLLGTLQSLYDKNLECLTNTELENLEPYVKSHIYQYLSDRFKSLEL